MSTNANTIWCRPGQSVMLAAQEHGLRIHVDSPTPGRSPEGVREWAAGRGLPVPTIVMVRRGEGFAAYPYPAGGGHRHRFEL